MSKPATQDETERRRPRSRLLWIVVATLLAVSGAAVVLALVLPGLTAPAAGRASEQPTESWATSTPEEQDMDSGKLEAMKAYIDEHDIPIDSIVVVRHGHIVFEMYGPGYSPDKRHKLHSVTKSVTSMLVGIAIDKGAIEGVDVPITALLPGYTSTNPDPRREQITLEHLLTMSSGIDWLEHEYPYEDSRNLAVQAGASLDVVQFLLNRPMAHAPGEVWAYNTGGSMVLGAIVEEATGRDLLLFAREVLFDPLGIGPVFWEQMADGRYETGGSLHMTPRDMARLGYLMLHNGRWNGQQILSADWVARSTEAYHQADALYGYGYQWWILPEGQGFMANGRWQQRIYVLPEADMVVVITADIRDPALYSVDGLVNAFVLPACTDLPASAAPAVYDAHGVTLEYPAGFFVEEAPLPDHRAIGTRSGIVQITSKLEPVESFSVFWNEVEEGEDVPMIFEAYLAAIAADLVELTPGESAEGQKDGHAMSLRFSKLTLEGGTIPAVSGVWICDVTGRAFGVTYLTTEQRTSEELLAALERYLQGLTCH